MTESWTDTLLPPGATPWESAVEETSAERWPLQWQLLRTLYNADEIPEEKLPILAWAMSVDLWDTSWPIEKKRSVVRQAIKDHALKGTIAGIRRYLDIEDGTLVSYLTPPQALYASRNLTKEEMDAWLETMPQLRIYLRSEPGDGTGLFFVNDGYADNDFATFDFGAEIYGRFPVIYDRGVEIPLRTSRMITTTTTKNATQIEQVSTRGVGGESFSDTDFAGALYCNATVKGATIFTLRTDREYRDSESQLFLDTAVPGLDPIDVRFTRESETGDGGPYMFAGDFADRQFFYGQDRGEWMLFDRIYLHDTTRATPLVDALSFADNSRISMSPFTMELMVDAETVTDTSPKFENDFAGWLYALPEDLRKIERQMDAVAIAKSYRSKALMTFETTRARTWGDGLPLDGSVPLWSRVDAAL